MSLLGLDAVTWQQQRVFCSLHFSASVVNGSKCCSEVSNIAWYECTAGVNYQQLHSLHPSLVVWNITYTWFF